MDAEHALGNAGYAITGSGGGGSDGNYVFVDLAELEAIKKEWIAIRNAIRADREKLVQAQGEIGPPANDEMSRLQPQMMIESLGRALAHNDTMIAYSDSYITKLSAARDRYVADDEQSTTRMRGVDVD